ncbi:MAG TPA: hypothetical protein IAC59_10155 [Candidatus Fimadaptatus faecigallinarum]|uniref:Uncharacterized protein n=1 Tax=Candidatus Fimadaptatus faecigallinarum TaxID=2840814 RepID=A0A9D1S537_9FIRM|nr:hypothetical protein [Candidatus Fimadaptatus faecigallinarum]
MLRRYVGLMVFVLAIVMLMPAVGMAEAATAAPADDTGGVVVEIPGVEFGEPLTWTYLATIAGAAAFTLLVVQFLKAPLDKVWKIPTRVFAYVVALGVMLVATAFTTGLTVDNALLVGVNALLAALSAYGAYEVTFGKIEKN